MRHPSKVTKKCIHCFVAGLHMELFEGEKCEYVELIEVDCMFEVELW